MAINAREVVQDVFSRGMEKEIWSGNYDKVLPITLNNFDIAAILPAVFYMFRFGRRRGRGNFLKVFGSANVNKEDSSQLVTIENVAAKLAATHEFDGFGEPARLAILGDLLLAFNLENVRREVGRDKQVQRVLPTHYMSSWIDLPNSSAHLRYVPETIVAMLADQRGEFVKTDDEGRKTKFPVATVDSHLQNDLLKAFNQGVSQKELVSDLSGDQFDERNKDVGIDQLLTIRIANVLGTAPNIIRDKGGPNISNQRPISEQATTNFSNDIRRFVRAYATVMPRHGFIETLEACISTGMTSVFTNVVEILFSWDRNGSIPRKNEQNPTDIFVDCSGGIDAKLRNLAENSFDELMRRIERVPTILMTMRLLDYEARNNSAIKKASFSTRPYATEWLDILGEILHGRHKECSFLFKQMESYGNKLITSLGEDYPNEVEILENERNEPNPVRRLALALTPLMGPQPRRHLIGLIDSILNSDRPNGLARKRRTTRGANYATLRKKVRDVRSVAFSDPVLDFLVHLHLLRSGSKAGPRPLSFGEFLRVVRDRYGFCVDIEPVGMTISSDLLRSNRMVLERRLRDLGLLVGVNDAEAMKRLRPRFDL